MLDRLSFVIREQIKVVSSVQTYDICDGRRGKKIGTAEESIGFLNKALRWIVNKQFLPTRLDIRKNDRSLVFSIRRRSYVLSSRLRVFNAIGELLNSLDSKILTLTGGFQIYDKDGKPFGELIGEPLGYGHSSYRFVTQAGAVEAARIVSFDDGMMKEANTSADSFRVDINERYANDEELKTLILATALAIDLIYMSESRGGLQISLENDEIR